MCRWICEPADYITVYVATKRDSLFSSNSEESASELLENNEDMFSELVVNVSCKNDCMNISIIHGKGGVNSLTITRWLELMCAVPMPSKYI